ILHPDSEPHKVLEQALADLREVLAGEAVEPKPYVETFNAGPVMAGASFVITVVADGPIRSITDNNGNIWVGEQPSVQADPKGNLNYWQHMHQWGADTEYHWFDTCPCARC